MTRIVGFELLIKKIIWIFLKPQNLQTVFFFVTKDNPFGSEPYAEQSKSIYSKQMNPKSLLEEFSLSKTSSKDQPSEQQQQPQITKFGVGTNQD